ncbi:MAG: ATP-dependent Lon protease [Thermoplasmata archaeon]|jgi:Lon-like ATP-dependent protease|nr:ATP-dependent Lon protease [Thermoplasmata archaeon]
MTTRTKASQTAPTNGHAKATAASDRMINDPYEWVDRQSGIQDSDNVPVPELLIEQVIGQDQAVAVARKAAAQKRNLLLIGDPGTGKSMIAKALKEMLPPQQLEDVLMVHNKKDPNAPLVNTTAPGNGKVVAAKMRRLARRKKVARQLVEWIAVGAILGLGFAGFFVEGFTLLTVMVFCIAVLVAAFLFALFRNAKDATPYLVPKVLLEYDPKQANHTRYVDATGSHAGALLGDVRHDPFQSGGLETPAHDRVEPGAIHKAHKGILFIDEINVLRLDSQQALLTAMQDRQYTIVGQSETSSGAMVKTAPLPCDFILVAAGNLDAIHTPDGRHTGLHPALRSRIRGYGYEVYVNSTMPDNHDNRLKLCRFVAQEVKNDGRIAKFEAHAIAEVILEGQRRSGQRGKLTLRLRELGGLVRTAGDVAQARGSKVVTAEDVREAKRLSRSLEQQIAEQGLEERRSHDGLRSTDALVGMAHGAGLVGTGEVGEPAGLVVPVNAAVTAPLSRQGGLMAFGGGLEGSAPAETEIVEAWLKKVTGTTVADSDLHVQSVIPQDGVDARGCGLAMAVSALSAVHGVEVRQDTVVIGGLTVTGAVKAVKGITQLIESAVDSGFARVVVPTANANDILLNPVYRSRVEIVQARGVLEVLEDVLVGKGKDKVLREVLGAGVTGGSPVRVATRS